MGKVLVNDLDLANIADSIRSLNGLDDTYKPSEMSAAINSIKTSHIIIVEDSSIRIIDMDAGIYKIKKNCKVYYYGTEDTTNKFITSSETYIIITDNIDDNSKYFFSIGNTLSGIQVLNYGYSRNIAVTQEGRVPGYIELLNFNDIAKKSDVIQKDSIIKIMDHPSNSSVNIDLSNYISSIDNLTHISVLSAYETYGYAMPNITEKSSTNISYKLSAETSNGVTNYYLKLDNLHTAIGYQYEIYILYV